MAEGIRTKIVRPYDSIEMRVPESWNQDSTAREYCVYFFPENGGPPTLHVRRDDFTVEKKEKPADGKPARRRPGGNVPLELENRFVELIERLEAPDIVNHTIEPKTWNGQLIRYTRVGEIEDKPGVSYWWVKGRRVGQTFIVMSCSLEVFAKKVEDPETVQLVTLIDREISNARILSVEEARSLKIAEEAAAKRKAPPAKAAESTPEQAPDSAPTSVSTPVAADTKAAEKPASSPSEDISPAAASGGRATGAGTAMPRAARPVQPSSAASPSAARAAAAPSSTARPAAAPGKTTAGSVSAAAAAAAAAAVAKSGAARGASGKPRGAAVPIQRANRPKS